MRLAWLIVIGSLPVQLWLWSSDPIEARWAYAIGVLVGAALGWSEARKSRIHIVNSVSFNGTAEDLERAGEHLSGTRP